MSNFHEWLNTIIAATGPAVLLWQLARVRRQAVDAAKGAEDAAHLAAGHAAAATQVVAGMASDVKVLAVNTNGLQDALNKVNREVGHLQGRTEAEAEAKEKP